MSPSVAELAKRHFDAGSRRGAAEYFRLLLPQSSAWQALSTIAGLDNHPAAALVLANKAVAADPGNISAHINLALTLCRAERYYEARREAECAVKFSDHPEVWRAWDCLARVAFAEGRYSDAIDAFREILSRVANKSATWRIAQSGCGQALLAAGSFSEGFSALREDWWHGLPVIECLDVPPWRNSTSALDGATVLVHDNQGYGDALQYARFLPQFTAVASVVLAVRQPLVKLLTRSGLASTVIDIAGPLPRADFTIPLSVLPELFGVSGLNDLPGTNFPYLLIDEICETFDSNALKVGLVWACESTGPDAAKRTVPLELLLPLAELPGVNLYGLQKRGSEQIESCGASDLVKDLSWAIRDFDDLAAFIAQMDVVVSVDTAPLHVAGALGIKCLVLLPYASEWRWHAHDRNDSPWYPSLKLFRQSMPGDWESVLARVRAELVKLLSLKRGV